MEEIVKMLLERAPVGILSWIGGVTMSVILLLISSKLRFIPLKLLFGREGIKRNDDSNKTFITEADLRLNCERRQRKLDSSLEEILSNTKKTTEQVGNIRERLSYMEGALGMKKQTG